LQITLIAKPLMDSEYIQPDPALRRAVLALLLGAGAAGTAAVAWFLPWLGTALRNARYSGAITFPIACYLFLALTAVMAGLVVWFAIYAIRFGRTVLASGQYPPTGSLVIRRTRVLRGRPAEFTGRGQVILGSALLLCGVALFAVALWGVVLIAA